MLLKKRSRSFFVVCATIYLYANSDLLSLSLRDHDAAQGTTMSENPHSEEIAKLLQALESVEQLSDERLSSALRQLAQYHEKTRSEVMEPQSLDQHSNPMVERIAAAMKLSIKAR